MNVQKLKKKRGITLVALVITIVLLLILSGITISTLGGENGLFTKVKESKKMHIQSEMQEQLLLALNELQLDKKGSASLDDVTQDWISSAISSNFKPIIKEDASLDGKMVVMTKSNIIGRFIVNQKLEISKTEYDISSLEFEYQTKGREDNKIKILIKMTDDINGIKQIDYPNSTEKPLILNNKKETIEIEYSVELGKEYKFIITSGDENKTEKTIKIDDYYYNVTKDFGESTTINNNATKAAYNKTYEATIGTEGNYAITSLVVTMGGQQVTTGENNIVDINTGKIKIENVTDEINIKVVTKKLEIQYTAIAVSTSSSESNTSSVSDNSQTRGTTLYINIIATLEGNSCTVVLKEDNSKTVPYAITTNGKYVFKVSGTYNGKVISEDKEVIVKKYETEGGFVQYDAGDWTKEEIEELQTQKLYDININKGTDSTYKLKSESGKNLTFGGFTYKGDAANASDIERGNIITSRNQSVSDYGSTPKYSGWKIFKSENKNGKSYVTKIIHAGSPENFVYVGLANFDKYRVLNVFQEGYNLNYNKLSDNITEINPRHWEMYKDKRLDSQGYIENVHIITREETSYYWAQDYYPHLYTGSRYWIASEYFAGDYINSNVSLMGLQYCDSGWLKKRGVTSGCMGIRPVVEMNEGVYIASGSGTEGDPYVLGKD